MTKWKIYNEDAVEWARHYSKAKFHALLCDAPYHLTSIVKRFGKKGSAPAKFGEDGVFQRSSKGFMGTQWDGGDLAFRPETWEAFGEVLHDGAFGMAFSASRNWHRMAVAIEDAGFILHPTIFLWSYGQGFPKATNISKQLDKGKEGPVIGQKKLWGHNAGSGAGSFSKNQYEGHTGETRYEDVHAPASDMSQAWVGHRYGLQALKPAVEPIIVFQKPFSGKPVENITRTGAGALNIDGGRIPLATDDEYTINTFDDGAKPFGNGAGHKFTSRKVENLHRNPSHQQSWKQTSPDGSGSMNDDWKQGRWPANLILTEESAERLNLQTGVLTSGKPSGKKKAGNKIYGQYRNEDVDVKGIGDSGGASRFFYTVQDQLDESDPAYYCAKVSPKERNAGLDDMLDVDVSPYSGEMSKLSDQRMSHKQNRLPRKNVHPTLKPIDLCRYLATLLLPPVEYAPRRIFIPFSGSGSEMIGAGLAGWEHVVGVEFDTENNYVEIAEKRLEHWLK